MPVTQPERQLELRQYRAVSVATVLARGQHGAVGAGVPAKGEQCTADVLRKKDLTHAMLTNSIKIGIRPAR